MDQRTLTDLVKKAEQQYGASHILTEIALALAQINAERTPDRGESVRQAILKFDAKAKR